MKYIFYILLGLLPSLVWLSYYLKKDKNPEPNRMIIRVFILGMAIAPLAVFFELLLIWLLNPTMNPLDIISRIPQSSYLSAVLAATLVPALVEEYLKYAVVRYQVIKKSVFDEPVDAMIYCIVAALGFAAVENLLILFSIDFPDFEQALWIISFRFLGATLLHALASAIVGYWLARGLMELKKRKKFVLIGLTLAIIFHACYNFLILTTFGEKYSELFYLCLTAILLISVAMTVSLCFKKLKKQQSICKT